MLVSTPMEQAELLGMGHVEPVEKQALHDRKNGCVGSYCQRQRDCRNRCKTPALAQDAHGITHVLDDALDEGQALLGMVLLANRFNRTESQYCLATRFSWFHPGSEVLLRLAAKVLFHLLHKPVVVALARRQVAKAGD